MPFIKNKLNLETTKSIFEVLNKKNYIMKTKILSLVSIALLTLSSCNRDDDPKIYSEENPLEAYLTNTGFAQKITNFINSGNYEFGLKFTPTVKGKVNAITVKIPDAATNVRVTFWDAASKTVLKTETIPSISANTELKYTLSSSLNLEKDVQYMITFNANDWYKRNKTDNTAAAYPVTAGNIKIDGYSWISGTTQTFPTNNDTTYYAGDISFVFQRVD